MDPRDRTYIYLEATNGFCMRCQETVPAKIIERERRILLHTCCPVHGISETLLEDDAAYYRRKRSFDKPATASTIQTATDRGCPWDCGLCPLHEQHTCIGLIEVTGACDLQCPVCYVAAGDGPHLDLDTIWRMMDFYQQAEAGRAEILQISGGEPTCHPAILDIIAAARGQGFKYVMLNTNGLRLATDRKFAQALGEFRGGFEVYLQFDGFREQTHRYLRGRDLRDIKRLAIENLREFRIPITLVCTVEKGLNEDELGRLVLYGLETPGVRGINIQPRAAFGRQPGPNPATLTISGLIHTLSEQTGGLLKPGDFLPLPCNVESVALTYLYRRDGGFVPITRNAGIEKYLPLISNTFFFKIEDLFKEARGELLQGRKFGECCNFIMDFKGFVPFNFWLKNHYERMDYIDENTFRISITRFNDGQNFTAKAQHKECVHIITPDLRRIPFSAYNLVHRYQDKK
jgi:uncharacterized radical SAM superfamily Fe-S cluster-containing enzyme